MEITIRIADGKKKEILFEVLNDLCEIKWERLDYKSISFDNRVILGGLLYWIIDYVMETAYREGYKEGHHIGFDEGGEISDNQGL